LKIRLQDNIPNDPDALHSLQIKTPQWELIRLDQVAEIRVIRVTPGLVGRHANFVRC
jgi:Cu/Ag efflux pump CusA